MAYFAPYLDETGLHIPTYTERMEALLESYRSIFGPEINLEESAPDYQLLSVLARALDDLSALLVSLFASRNPAYAAGSALDLLLPLHGITREGTASGTETDASARHRFALAASAPARTIAESLADALAGVPNVSDAKILVNDTGETDAHGIPPHSICALVQGGAAAAIAKVIFNKKAPGIGTWGATSATVTDAFGVSHPIHFQRAATINTTVTVRLTPLTGFDETTLIPAIRQAVFDYVSTLGIGQELVVPVLYGICYSAEKAATPTFSVTQILALVTGGSATSGVLAAEWNQRFVIPSVGFVNVVVG